MKIIIISLTLITSIFSAGLPAEAFSMREGHHVPCPRLLEPKEGKVDISGKEFIAFSWDRHVAASGEGKYFIFKIYNGALLLDKNLILNKRIPGTQTTVKIGRDLFEPGQVYTWTLRMGLRGEGKSSRKYSTFAIVGGTK